MLSTIDPSWLAEDSVTESDSRLNNLLVEEIASSACIRQHLAVELEHMSEKYVRASDIADYIYCRRSWWLSRGRLQRPEDDGPFARGTRVPPAARPAGATRSIWGRRIALDSSLSSWQSSSLLLGGG
jgi:hypothetical protein